jgi:hypothetical protein
MKIKKEIKRGRETISYHNFQWGKEQSLEHFLLYPMSQIPTMVFWTEKEKSFTIHFSHSIFHIFSPFLNSFHWFQSIYTFIYYHHSHKNQKSKIKETWKTHNDYPYRDVLECCLGHLQLHPIHSKNHHQGHLNSINQMNE